jgi:hypothetical protein
MDYEDKSLEAMSHEELLNAAKHLRDRIRDGYNFLITDYHSRIKSAKTGQYVSFAEFIETGYFREMFLEYMKDNPNP